MKYYTRRFFSSGFKASDTQITKIRQGFAKPDYSKPLKFGSYHTDHMLEIDYDEKSGWTKPYITPYHNLSLDPRNSAIHYAISLFEGLKAYRKDDDVYLFRPDLNMKRMNHSASRVGLPQFDGEEFIKCMEKLLVVDKDWAHPVKGFSIYIRPTFISISDVLGVSVPTKAKLFVIMSPVGPYFTSGYTALSLICNDDSYVRSFHGGFGERKLAANYGPTLQKYNECLKNGYNQVLWLVKDNITECGVMNYFTLIKNKSGENELITCNLDGTVLPGVTRQSIIDLAKSWGVKVTERPFSIHELLECHNEGRVSI
jgi:branched-chain amino acid aminotransferase